MASGASSFRLWIMSPTKLLKSTTVLGTFLISILISTFSGCSKFTFSKNNEIDAVAISAINSTSHRFTLTLQNEESVSLILSELRKDLLMPDASSGEVFFNPGSDQDLLSVSSGLPDLRFRSANFDIPVFGIKSWLLSSKENGNGLNLNLVISNDQSRSVLNKGMGPAVMNRPALLNLLKLRIDEGIVPNSFSLASGASTKINSNEVTDTTRPFFFTLESRYPKSSLFGQACKIAESYLYALQLTKSLKPEASIEIDLQCQISFLNLNENQSTNGLTLMSLSLPWKKVDSEQALFNSAKDFTKPDKHSRPTLGVK